MEEIYMDGNATPEEHYRRHGQLPERVVFDLIDAADHLDAAKETLRGLSEAQAGFPDEDCLQDIIRDLATFGLSVRGERKQEVRALIERLEARQTELWQAAEYGREVLVAAVNDERIGG